MAAPANAQEAQVFIETNFGYPIQHLALFQEAMDLTGLIRPKGNKHLAVLGDAALDLALAKAWYNTGTPQGVYSNHSQKQVCNDNLAAIARGIGLAAQMTLHPGQVGALSRDTLATSLEAVFGAIYLDCGGDISIMSAAIVAVGIQVSPENN